MPLKVLPTPSLFFPGNKGEIDRDRFLHAFPEDFSDNLSNFSFEPLGRGDAFPFWFCCINFGGLEDVREWAGLGL